MTRVAGRLLCNAGDIVAAFCGICCCCWNWGCIVAVAVIGNWFCCNDDGTIESLPFAYSNRKIASKSLLVLLFPLFTLKLLSRMVLPPGEEEEFTVDASSSSCRYFAFFLDPSIHVFSSPRLIHRWHGRPLCISVSGSSEIEVCIVTVIASQVRLLLSLL